MSKKITKEGAEYLLRNVEPERCFWVNNGQIISNLEGLEIAIKEMGKESFSYHVNKDKNDFSVWISDVIEDKTLAKDISKAKTKEKFLKKVKERVSYLKKAAGK